MAQYAAKRETQTNACINEKEATNVFLLLRRHPGALNYPYNSVAGK